ncbi:MAG: molecular chaperone HtpG [Alphaproteobacteria bacterium]|nr:molecular chaperone HtpG [Alphaproteobacteria bacterium]
MAEDTPSQEPRTLGFTAEVRQLLDLVIHSLYSDREIFLRELISNASDALDRARFLTLSRPELRAAEGEPQITITADAEAGTLTITDNGIGLTAEEAVEHLGTIARSGTKAFAQAMEEDEREEKVDASTLIGQFGVGFYSALMVAERVEVRSLSGEPEAEAILWSCDGSTDYHIGPGERETRGTDVVLHLREDAKEYLEADRLQEVVQRHSRYVGYPIYVGEEQVNEPKALWTRDPSELEDDDYKGFYKQLTGDWADPATWAHIRADVPMQYRALLFIPSQAPMDLNYVDGKRVMKLYARRVLIDEEARKLLPDYLRFVRGVVDSEDIQLNVSREMVQKTPLFDKLGKQLTGKVLRHLRDLAKKDPEEYTALWRDFGTVLKEGLHSDADQRKRLLELARFYSTRANDDSLVSLQEYVEAMPEGQDTIWFLTGPDLATARRSPHLEAFKKKGWEVLLMVDPVDEWVVQSIHAFEETPLKSVARGELELDEEEEAKELDEDFIGWLNGLLAGEVKEVRASNRLTNSASVLVDDEWGLSGNMQRILASVQKGMPPSMRILEVNPSHPMVEALANLHAQGRASEAEPLGRLLLDQAQLAEGVVSDPGKLLERMRALGNMAARGLGLELPEAPAADAAPGVDDIVNQVLAEAEEADAVEASADESAAQGEPEREEVVAELVDEG